MIIHFKELVESYLHRSSGSLTICFVKLRPSCLPMFVRSGLWDLVGGESRFFNKIRDALEAVGLTEDGDEVGDGVGDRYSIASSYQGGGGGGTIHLINRIHRGGSASSSASSAYKNLEHSQCGQNEAHEETGSV